MDETTPWEVAIKRGVQFAQATHCSTLEINFSNSLPQPVCLVGSVNDETISEWLEELSPQPGQASCGGAGSRLRLLIAVADFDGNDNSVRMSIREDIFTGLNQRLYLPGCFASLITSYHVRGFKYPISSRQCHCDDMKPNYGFFLRRPYWDPDFVQLAITHDARTNSSTGFAVVHSGHNLILDTITGYETTFGVVSSQPLLLPLIILDSYVQLVTRWLQNNHLALERIAVNCGQTSYGDTPFSDLPDPLATDFVAATRRLTGMGHGTAHDMVKVNCVLLALEQASKWSHSIESRRETTEKSNLQNNSDLDFTVMKAKAEYLKDTCNVLLLEAACAKSRIRDLSQAIYHYMAAKNARANISIAETSAIIAKASKEDSAAMRTIAIESKRDSSGMKTISLLGMIFLPGTFVAAIFSMPVFNWDEDGATLIGSGFKYYWAVTIPLTILVLTTWAMGMLLPWEKLFARRWRSWKDVLRNCKEASNLV